MNEVLRQDLPQDELLSLQEIKGFNNKMTDSELKTFRANLVKENCPKPESGSPKMDEWGIIQEMQEFVDNELRIRGHIKRAGNEASSVLSSHDQRGGRNTKGHE